MNVAKAEQDPRRSSGRRADIRYSLHLLSRNPVVVVGIVISVASLIIAGISGFIVNPNAWIVRHPQDNLCWNNPVLNWGIRNINPCGGSVHSLGTDLEGRDVLQMIVLAIPVDLQIAFEVVASAIAIGVVLGAIAGYAGGLIDEALLRITDIFLSIPVILLALVLIVVINARTFGLITFALAITWWPTYVRLVRSQILSEKERMYVESLRAMGAGRIRILFRHVVPNSIYPIVVQATLDIGTVILTVSALTFIGLTPNPLFPELGNLVAEGQQHLFTAPWLVIFPGLVIFLISLGFNLLGDGLRDVFDPRLRR